MCIVLRLTALLFLWPVALSFAEETNRPLVDVELLVRGPDAKPLASTVVVITPDKARGFEPQRAAINTKTDEHGVARFKVLAGVCTMKIGVDSVGYGSIGITEYISGKLAKPHLPPLAPYGTIEGTIARNAMKPGAVVRGYLRYDDDQPSVKADANGHFKFTNARGGLWGIWAEVDKEQFCTKRARVHAGPGPNYQGRGLEGNTQSGSGGDGQFQRRANGQDSRRRTRLSFGSVALLSATWPGIRFPTPPFTHWTRTTSVFGCMRKRLRRRATPT